MKRTIVESRYIGKRAVWQTYCTTCGAVVLAETSEATAKKASTQHKRANRGHDSFPMVLQVPAFEQIEIEVEV